MLYNDKIPILDGPHNYFFGNHIEAKKEMLNHADYSAFNYFFSFKKRISFK